MKGKSDEVRIMFVGDINLGEYYTSFGHGPRSYIKSGSPFSNVNDVLNKADFAVGNLEAPLTTENEIPGEPESNVLRGSPKDAYLLTEANFRILQVANNHTVQHGKSGFDETVAVLSRNDISPVGLRNQEVVIVESKGVKLGFIAASDVPDNTNVNQESYQKLDSYFLERIKHSVSKVDHLFVLLHWGLESSTERMSYQSELAKELSELGVRAVIGHHPHLFYEITASERFVFAPSLGNFVFDLAWDERLLKTGILDITIKDSEMTTRVWPITIRKNGCLPSPSGQEINVNGTLKLYDHGKSMEGEQLRKTIYFFRNIILGDTILKIKFFSRKMIPLMKQKGIKET